MYIKIYQLDKGYQDAVLEMGGEIKWANGSGDIDVVFSTDCKVAVVTLNNECVGFTSPKNIGFDASSDEFYKIEIF